MELLFTELNTTAKIMFSKGILMLFLTLFVFVYFVIPSKLTARKETLDVIFRIESIKNPRSSETGETTRGHNAI